MSNTQVGNVYSQIIADVIESSRVDFEEGGVDEHVLDELRRGWEQKLSQLGVATFPWDPKVEPQQPTITNPPTVPSNAILNNNPMPAGNYQLNPALPNQMPQQAMPSMQQMNNNGNPRIKTEPGLENSPIGGMNQPNFQAPPIAGTTAQQRAAAHLQANYGQRAAASISAIQGSAPQQHNPQQNIQQMQAHQQAMHQQQQHQMQQQMQQQRAGGVPQQRPQITQEQYQKAMAMNAMQQRQSIQSQNGVNGAQTDGTGDEFEGPAAILKRVNLGGEEELGRLEIDGLIRDQILAKGQAMEGGGLMLPLREATNSKARQRKVKKSGSGLAQHDGPGSDDDEDGKDNVKDEELDEDAINSDLDDPDDGLNDEEDDDEGMGHIMLCMYDKVQRVKNKWKCVMKDGVLTVNGKEYVFHKASGEYEW